MLSAYEYLKNGASSYATRTMNSPKCSLASVKNFVKDLVPTRIPGEIYVEELSHYLESRGLSRDVALSVDCTRLSRAIEYCAKTNLILGISPPLDPETSFPDIDFCAATSPSRIIDVINSCASAPYLEAYMVQPIEKGAKSFNISAIPTDNAFKAVHVTRRAVHIQQQLRKTGINMTCLCADGAGPYFACHKCLSRFGKVVDFFGFKLFADPSNEVIGAMQDPIHLLQKMKMRLIQTGVDIWMGKYLVTNNHVQSVLKGKKFTLVDHGLSWGDVQNSDKTRDKMNFGSTNKLLKLKVLECLETVEGSEGTVQFIKLMMMLKEAFMKHETTIEMRIYNAIYCLSFLRRWRQDIVDKGLPVSSFITSNAFTCIELNVAFLARMVRDGLGDAIVMCSSQVCEEFFRTLRATSTWGLTQVNMTVKEAMLNISKFQALMDVVFFLHTEEGINFKEAFAQQSSTTLSKFEKRFLFEDDIAQLVADATKSAALDALKFGISAYECDTSELLSHGEDIDEIFGIDSSLPNRPPPNKIRFSSGEMFGVKYTQVGVLRYVEEESLTSIIRQIKSFEPLETVAIHKSVFIRRLMPDGVEHVSSDRNLRFIAPTTAEHPSNKMAYRCEVRDELSLDDYVIVRQISSEFDPNDDHLIVGKVVSFAIDSKEKSLVKKKWAHHTAKLSTPNLTFQLQPAYNLDFSRFTLLPYSSRVPFRPHSYECTTDIKLFNFEAFTINDSIAEFFREASDDEPTNASSSTAFQQIDVEIQDQVPESQMDIDDY